MAEARLSDLLRAGEHLVCYELPRMSGLWGVLMAPGQEAILERYPELCIVVELPSWMDSDQLQRMREAPLWLDDDPPQGLLGVLVSDRDRD